MWRAQASIWQRVVIQGAATVERLGIQKLNVRSPVLIDQKENFPRKLNKNP
jgi:hypothetical protein